MRNCRACGIKLRKGTVCDYCKGWQLKVGYECFCCEKLIDNDEDRYLEKGNVCDKCTDKINKWYWWERANKYRKK